MTLSNSDIGSNNNSDMGQWYFLDSTGAMGNIKRQRYATLAFLKIDMGHQDPPVKAPRAAAAAGATGTQIEGSCCRQGL